MKTLLVRIVIGIVAFIVGIATNAIWLRLQKPKSEKPTAPISIPIEPAPAQNVLTPDVGEAQHPTERIPAELHPKYPELLATLKRLVAEKGRAKTNTFYISPVRQEKYAVAQIHWKEDKSILLLPFSELDQDAGWLYFKFRTDLTKDVVPTGKYLNLGCCLVEKDRVDAVLADCRSGKKVVIVK